MKNPYLHYQNNSRYWIRSTKQKSKEGVVGETLVSLQGFPTLMN